MSRAELQFADLTFSLDDDGEREEVSRGSSGTVYKGLFGASRRPVAIKVIPAANATAAHLTAFWREVNLQHMLSASPRVVNVLGGCLEYSKATGKLKNCIVVMDLEDGGTLATLHEGHALGISPVPLKQRLQLLLDVAQALRFIHSNDVCHADLKPANILLSPSGCKLTDFGLARVRKDGTVAPRSTTAGAAIGGTPVYSDPVLQQGGQLTKPSDIYAFGVLAWELLCGQSAFPQCATDYAVHAHVSSGGKLDLAALPSELSPWMPTLLNLCQSLNPKARPTAGEVCQALESGSASLRSSAGGAAAAPAPASATTCCCVCMAPTAPGSGVACASGRHLTCSACLQGIVLLQADRAAAAPEEEGEDNPQPAAEVARAPGGGTCCPSKGGCASPPWTLASAPFASALTLPTLRSYATACSASTSAAAPPPEHAAQEATPTQLAAVRSAQRSSSLYACLGVPASADTASIRAAFTSQFVALHPASNPAPGAQQAFAAVCQAFVCLADRASRESYDDSLAMAAAAPKSSSSSSSAGSSTSALTGGGGGGTGGSSGGGASAATAAAAPPPPPQPQAAAAAAGAAYAPAPLLPAAHYLPALDYAMQTLNAGEAAAVLRRMQQQYHSTPPYARQPLGQWFAITLKALCMPTASALQALPICCHAGHTLGSLLEDMPQLASLCSPASVSQLLALLSLLTEAALAEPGLLLQATPGLQGVTCALVSLLDAGAKVGWSAGAGELTDGRVAAPRLRSLLRTLGAVGGSCEAAGWVVRLLFVYSAFKANAGLACLDAGVDQALSHALRRCWAADDRRLVANGGRLYGRLLALQLGAGGGASSSGSLLGGGLPAPAALAGQEAALQLLLLLLAATRHATARTRLAAALWELLFPRTHSLSGLVQQAHPGVVAWMVSACGGAGALGSLRTAVAHACATEPPSLSPPLLGLYFAFQRACKGDGPSCAACAGAFGLLRLRHSCRTCGERLCSSCMAGRRRLPSLGLGTEPVRVCQACVHSGVTLQGGFKISLTGM